MKNFTVEETNLMCCFNTSSRKRLIDDMKRVTLNDMDGEIAELMYKTIQKLEAVTDAEFEELYISTQIHSVNSKYYIGFFAFVKWFSPKKYRLS